MVGKFSSLIKGFQEELVATGLVLIVAIAGSFGIITIFDVVNVKDAVAENPTESAVVLGETSEGSEKSTGDVERDETTDQSVAPKRNQVDA